MSDRGIYDGMVAIFQLTHALPPGKGEIVVVEKPADEEGTGGWSLKRLFIEGGSPRANDLGDPIDWQDKTITLKSCCHGYNAWTLDAAGNYVVRGLFVRAISATDAEFADSETVRTMANEESET